MSYQRSDSLRTATHPPVRLRHRLSRSSSPVAALGVLLLIAPSAHQQVRSAGIFDLQPSLRVTALQIDTVDGRTGTATLYNLNPRINVWYVLGLAWQGEAEASFYHLENPAPRRQTIFLDEHGGRGLRIGVDLDTYSCELWSTAASAPLAQARRSGASYAPLCDGRLYLRNPSVGHRTTKELVTDFLRDRVWGGEQVISLVKDRLMRDAHIERAPEQLSAGAAHVSSAGPMAAAVAAPESGQRPLPPGLGIEIDSPGTISFGRWYPARAIAHAFISFMQPGAVAPALLATYGNRVKPLDSVESEALVYLIAFDLAHYELGFELGTDHPRLEWSERTPAQVRRAELPGPDGIETALPLVRTGIVNPVHIPRTVATFVGGFKRTHGAFRYGELSQRNNASHYGWIENGVVFSSLQPGLATLLVRDSGMLDLQTWQRGDELLLPSIRHARQNGVPIIESRATDGTPVPGALVGSWGGGNWSGSASGEQRTVRSGVCLQTGAGRFLIYGYFSSVNPSAMARVFQAYGCDYAMLLDINALEHTYLAVYRIGAAEVQVQHLVRGMEEVDKTSRGQPAPRFIAYPDSRDFFYVMQRAANEP